MGLLDFGKILAVFGWNAEDTVRAADYIAANGLPSADVTVSRPAAPPPIVEPPVTPPPPPPPPAQVLKGRNIQAWDSLTDPNRREQWVIRWLWAFPNPPQWGEPVNELGTSGRNGQGYKATGQWKDVYG